MVCEVTDEKGDGKRATICSSWLDMHEGTALGPHVQTRSKGDEERLGKLHLHLKRDLASTQRPVC